jgi:hypothetical protein
MQRLVDVSNCQWKRESATLVNCNPITVHLGGSQPAWKPERSTHSINRKQPIRPSYIGKRILVSQAGPAGQRARRINTQVKSGNGKEAGDKKRIW